MLNGKNQLSVYGLITVGWCVLTTLATLYLGVKTYSNSSLKDKLDAREKLDNFVLETRRNYGQRCNSKTEEMRESWSQRYILLLKLADIDSEKQPYSNICEKIIYGIPIAPNFFSVNISYPHPVATYPSWEAFVASSEKVATLWVEDLPVYVDIQLADLSLLKTK